MTGKGLLSLEQIQRGLGQLTDDGETAFKQILLGRLSDGEHELIRFLTAEFAEFAPIENADGDALRRSTGLRRGGW